MYPCKWFRAFLAISLNCPNALNTLRQEQVNLLVYGPAQPYFKKKQNNITKFLPTGFFLNLLFSAFWKKTKKKQQQQQTYINNQNKKHLLLLY